MSESFSAADRTSKAFAANVFEKLYTSDEVRQGCIQVLVESIRFAHQQGESCWGVTLFKAELRLNVGQVEVLVLRPEEVYLVLDRTAVSEVLRAQLEAYLSPPKSIYRSVPGEKIQCWIPPADLMRVYPLITTAHQSFIVNAARRKSTTPFQSSFSTGVIRYLRTVSAGDVPLPSYVLEEAHGEPRLPEEVEPATGYLEGAVCQVTINAYERNRNARIACIAHYGPTCVVCGFNFGAVYGPIAEVRAHSNPCPAFVPGKQAR